MILTSIVNIIGCANAVMKSCPYASFDTLAALWYIAVTRKESDAAALALDFVRHFVESR